MWIVDGAQIEHQCLLTFALGMTKPQHDQERVVYCLLMLVWLSHKSVALLMHMICCGVDSSILIVHTIFDNTIDGFSMEFDVDSSMESICNST